MKLGGLFTASIFSVVFAWSAVEAKPLGRQSLRHSSPVALQLHVEELVRQSTKEEAAAKAELRLVESSAFYDKWKPPPPKTPWKEMPTEIHAKEPGGGYPQGSPLHHAQQGMSPEANITKAANGETSGMAEDLPKNMGEATSVSFWQKYWHLHHAAIAAYPFVYFIFWMLVGLIYVKVFQHRQDKLDFEYRDPEKQADAPLKALVQETQLLFENLDYEAKGIVSKVKLVDALKSSSRVRELFGVSGDMRQDITQQGQHLESIFQALQSDAYALDSKKYMVLKDVEQWIRSNCASLTTRSSPQLSPRPTLHGELKEFEFGLFHCSKQSVGICLCSWFCLPIRWAETISSVPKPDYAAAKGSQYGLHTFWTALCIFTVPIGFCGLSSGFGFLLFLALAVYYRQTLRAVYDLENYTCRSCCTDALLWTFCGCCAAAQEAMQVQYTTYKPRSSWKTFFASLVPGFVPGVLLTVIVLSFVFF